MTHEIHNPPYFLPKQPTASNPQNEELISRFQQLSIQTIQAVNHSSVLPNSSCPSSIVPQIRRQKTDYLAIEELSGGCADLEKF